MRPVASLTGPEGVPYTSGHRKVIAPLTDVQQPVAGLNGLTISVVFKIDSRPIMLTPRGQETNEDANSKRSEHTVWPYDLWTAPCGAVPGRLLGEQILIQETEALHTRGTWHRKNDLS